MAVAVEEKERTVNDKPEWKLISDKMKAYYTVKPTNDGYVFYEISVSVGSLAEELKGIYTTSNSAIAAFKSWEDRQTKSQTKARDDKQARIKQHKESMNA